MSAPARGRSARLALLLAVVLAATGLVACESAQVDRVNATRAEAAVAHLPVADDLTLGARAHAAAMCSSGAVAPSADPNTEYGSSAAVAVVDLVGRSPLDPVIEDEGVRNGEATTAIWTTWSDDPRLVDPRWDAIGVGEHTCTTDGQLYMTLVLRDDPPLDCRGTGSTAEPNLAYASVPGVNPNLLSLDLYLPVRPAGCPPPPIVVYVHGGGFAIGDKDNRIDDKVALFTGEGWAFASVNYRLSPNPPNSLPGQVRYPVHEQDVATALAWLGDRAAAEGFDADRIALVGHSAGAYLVSLLGADPSFLIGAGVAPSALRCVTSIDTEYDAAMQIAQGGTQEVVYRNAFGDDPATWAAASPITHVGGPIPDPAFLIFTRGTPRRVDQAEDFRAALAAAGGSATALVVNPLSHEEVNDVVGAPGDTVVTPPLVDFLRSCTAG